MGDTRHNARMIALQRLFELSFPGFEPTQLRDSILSDNHEDDGITKFDQELVTELVEGVKNEYKQIDSIVGKLAPEWPLDKINKIDLQILRIAILEAYILKITPEKVAINEAIELSKEFSSEQSRRFVNGVLGNLLKNKEKYIKE